MADVVSIPASSAAAADRSRKCLQGLLQTLAKMDLATIARAIGKSESTACRLRDGEASLTPAEWCDLIVAAEKKLVDQSKYCVDKPIYEATVAVMTKAMANPAIAQQLMWDDEQ